MTEEQRAELRSIREEQSALRTGLERLESRLAALVEPPPASPRLPPPVPVAPVIAAEAPETLEVRLGAKWFVRLAVFMLVAALAFLANHLYQHIIPHLGPAAKIGLLYLGAGALTGVGLWLERSRQSRESEGVLNYARVVLAGGLAAVYYVTYAAHHFDRLRVIESPLLAGLLLLGWTAFMTWLADRRGSQTLAAFSILLAFFASATSDVAGFTLIANLGLTAAAVFLVLRQRWTVFSFACLTATFGSYAFWRYGDLFGAGAGGGLWTEGAFLACYWALFTFAAFADRQGAFDEPGRRASFITLNNVAFFTLVGLLVHDQTPLVFWRWPLAFGLVLLALGELGRRLPRRLDEATLDACGFGGVASVTFGFVLYFSGWRLSIILAVESAAVLAAACWRGSWALRVAAYGVGLACAFAVFGSRDQWLAGTVCGAILLCNAWQCRRSRSLPGEGYFSFLGLLVWFVVLEVQISDEFWRSPILALTAVGLTAALYRLPAALGIAQLYLLAAHLHWLNAYLVPAQSSLPPLWNPAVVLGVTVALGSVADRLKKGLSVIYEIGAFVLFVVVAEKYFDPLGQFTLLAAGGAAALGIGRPRLRWWGLALNVLAVLTFVVATHGRGLLYLPGILLLAIARLCVRHSGERRLEGALVSAAALCLWVWLSRQLHHGSVASFTIAAGWSLYGGALFGIGIAARERVCRWWGLGVLAAALAHIVLIDIWTLDNLERFVSLFAISLVLLGIGFFYNRMSSSIREWL